MELPALSIRSPNLAQIYAAAESIRGARLKNKLTEAQIKKTLRLQELAGDIFTPEESSGPQMSPAPWAKQTPGRASVPSAPWAKQTPGRASVPSADSPAVQKYMALDPKGGKQIIEAINAMDEGRRKRVEDANNMRAKAALAVLDSPPEQRPMVYAQVLADLERRGVDVSDVPRQYDEGYVHQQMRLSMSMADILQERERANKAKADVVKIMTPNGPKYVPKAQAAGKTPYSDKAAYPKMVKVMKNGRPTYVPENEAKGMEAYDSPLVKIDNTQDSAQNEAYGKQVGKFYGERFTNLQAGADMARMQNARLDRLDQLLDQTYTGTGAKTLVDVQKAGELFGIDLSGLPGNAGPAEAAQALANEMALELRNPAGGAGMPGSMSNSDRDFLTSMVPGLGQTPEGRKLLIEAKRKVNRRSMKVAAMAREYARKNGQLDAGFEAELQAWSDKNPLFTKEDMNLREKARLPRVTDRSSYDALAVGTYYTSPDGQVRQKTVE